MKLTSEQLQELDKRKMYCAIVERLGEENRVLNPAEESYYYKKNALACKEATDELLKVEKDFQQYKKQMERSPLTTHEETFQHKREKYEEKQDACIEAFLYQAVFYEMCNQYGTIVYPMEEGFFDILNNSLLADLGGEVLQDTLVPLLAYCNPEDVSFQIVSTPTSSKGIRATLPEVIVQSGDNKYKGPLLSVYTTQYQQKRMQVYEQVFLKYGEDTHFSKKKVK